eukprot:gnl/TRDRNA2_/TRDRNA2_87982_c0_seq1.p1 gnl/TRDRNA2_/TRDRNA2_87982_c0~~gnl/TRDRNA2_/TRDRNA2_87982_c0_seq1.p1  ORF type:complete len:188 (+),score=20.17 gnl/TRDRNA2_/TRDRNA2_87982_c0_seq1:63-626(+)
MTMLRCIECLFFCTVSLSLSMVRSESCDQIPIDRVFDVQWSGDVSAANESALSFDRPMNTDTLERLQVEDTDYFTLMHKADDKYQLKHFGLGGALKFTFPEGMVKANTAVVFYIIDEWFATVITRSPHELGDSVEFSNLVTEPSQSQVETALGASCLSTSYEASGSWMSSPSKVIFMIALTHVWYCK